MIVHKRHQMFETSKNFNQEYKKPSLNGWFLVINA